MSAKARAPVSVYGQGVVASGRWLVPALLLSLVFIMASRVPIDSDLWWHLRAGEETLRTGRPLLVDTFSHTRTATAWTNHSWLGQAALYLLFLYGHYLGLGIAVALMATVSMALVYYQMENPPLARVFIIVLAAAVAAPVWSPRPQIISLCLFAILSYLLYLYKWRCSDRLWLGIPLFILWSNVHGGYVLGLVLVACVFLGEIVNNLLGIKGNQVLAWQRIGRLAIWVVVYGLVVIINPNGVSMWLIPFRTVGIGVLQSSISEWASPDFHDLSQQPFIWMLLLTLAAVGLSRRRMDAGDLLVLAAFAYLALLARRNYGPFALLAAPVLSRHLNAIWLSQRKRLLGGRPKRAGGDRKSPPVRNWINIPMVTLLVLSAAAKVYLVSQPRLVDKYTQEIFPVKAADWIEENLPAGRLFNDYNWGGYLAWRLRSYPVFVDGRTDLFDDTLLEEYLQVAAAADGWEKTLQQYQVSAVIVAPNSGLAKAMRNDSDWIKGYADQVAVVYVSPID